MLPAHALLSAGKSTSGITQVGSRCCNIDIMLIMKHHQLIKQSRGSLAGGMTKRCGTSHHLERDPRQSASHSDVNVSGILPLVEPPLTDDLEVIVAATEGLGGHEQDLAEPTVALRDQPVPIIHGTTLMPPGEQPRTTRDDPTCGVVRDGPQFPAQFRGQHHVDSREGQECT